MGFLYPTSAHGTGLNMAVLKSICRKVKMRRCIFRLDSDHVGGKSPFVQLTIAKG